MINRREFMIAGAAAVSARANAPNIPPLCIFSKHMAALRYDQLAREAKHIGFDGVDLTVRPKGHVLPERAAEDLPRAVEVLRAAGLSVPMITTELLSASDAPAAPTLSTAAALKIPFWKPGYWHYNAEDVEASLSKATIAAAGLATLSSKYGLVMGIHNHSGDYVGSSVWDVREMLTQLDPKLAGYYFDPAHATIEGGLGGWRTSLRMSTSRLKMVALKDFYWAKNDSGKWVVRWCPLGEGMVNWSEVFRILAASRFSGPISLHVEYEAKNELEAIARDFEFMKKLRNVAYGVA